jgi:hypothetical protein
MITPTTPDKSASCARIGYGNFLISSTEAPNALEPNTYQRYTPGTGSTVAKFQLSTSTSIDYVAIAAHNIGTHDDGTDIVISYATTIGGALTEIDTLSPVDNAAIFLSFDAISVAEIAITTDTSIYGMEIGVVQAGEALVMEQPIYGGHSPIDLNQATEYENSMSESGQFLGRTVLRQGLETSFSWQHLTPAWCRSTFQPFVSHAVTLPFFIQWRPDLYDAAVYGYTTGDINPTNMGGGSGLMSANFKMVAHSDV